MGEQVFGFFADTAARLVKISKARPRRNGVLAGAADELVFGLEYAVVASDAALGDLTIRAWPGKLDATNRIVRDTGYTGPPWEVINLDTVFTDPVLVRAGYGFLVFDDDAGNRSPICQRCIQSCGAAGSITFADQTFAVGETVNQAVSASGTVSGVGFSALPAGLTFNSATMSVTGEPTKAGVTWSTITGTATSGATTCTITKLIKWTITE